MELLLYKKVVGNRYRHGGAGCRAKKLTLYAAKDLNHKCRRKSPLCMEEKKPILRNVWLLARHSASKWRQVQY